MTYLRNQIDFERKKAQILEQKGYTFLEAIGTRQNTLISLVFDGKHNSQVVLKEIYIQSQVQAQLAYNEIRILSSINSEFFAKYIDHFSVDEKVIFIVQEYIDGVDLFKRINVNRYQQLTELDIERIFIQILQGLQYLHSVNIIHGDVRLESIVLQEFNQDIKCRFVSLEFSRFDTDIQIAKQNLLYTPPESLKDGIMSFQSDLWQLGCLFYQLQMRVHPFYDQDERQMQNNIRRGKFNDVANFQFNEILKQLLNPTPEKRPECIEILNSYFELRLDYRPGKIRKRNPIQYNQQQSDQEQQQDNIINYNHRVHTLQSEPLIVQQQPFIIQLPPVIVQSQRQRLNITQSFGIIQPPRVIIPRYQITNNNRQLFVINTTRR